VNFIAHPDRAELIEIGRLIDEGRVHPHVSAVFELKEAAEAQAQLERQHAQGKVVLQMG
jgi:NADPH:quinone reductase-like Zn-dependent oxidoreductase